MQIISLKRFSVLGLVLVGASAVTAVMAANKSDKKEKDAKFAAGSLTRHSSLNNAGNESSRTCAPDSDAAISTKACNDSVTGVGTVTTATGNLSSNGEASSASNDHGVGSNETTSADVIA